MKEQEFKPGDRIRVVGNCYHLRHSLHGLTGTIRWADADDECECAAIEFDKFMNGRNCNGYTPNGYGLFMRFDQIEKINDLEPGDKIKDLVKTPEEQPATTDFEEALDRAIKKINNMERKEESDEVTASKKGIIEAYEAGCDDLKDALANIFPETIKEHKEGKKKKSWYMNQDGDYIMALDKETEKRICSLFSVITLSSTPKAKFLLEEGGYDPYEHGHQFDEEGRIIIQ